MDSPLNPTSSPALPRSGFLQQHPLVGFFSFAFLFAWLAWVPVILSQTGVGVLPFKSDALYFVSLTIGIFTGPTLAAFIMASVTEGRAGRRALWQHITKWRIGVQWYLIPILGFIVLYFLGSLLALAVVRPNDVALPLQTFPGSSPYLIVYVILIFTVQLLGGPLGEEPGWRGFALPRMQRALGPLGGSLLLGVLWWAWHLPLLLFLPIWRSNIPPLTYGAIFMGLVLCLSVTMAWIYNSTKGSVTATIITHSASNASGKVAGVLFLLTLTNAASFAVPFLVGFVAVFAVATIGLIAFTRGRLGYSPQ
jgi:membrane protease YdiL (CAAX protease family)